MREFTGSIQRDLDRHSTKIRQNEKQPTLLTDGVNTTKINLGKLRKEETSLEDDMMKRKEKMEREKEVMSRRLHDMENLMKSMNEKIKVSSQVPPAVNRDAKNLIPEGLNENCGEDVYNTVIGTIKKLCINIQDNDINLANRIGTYNGDNTLPRPIRVELISSHVRDIIWQNRQKLDDSLSHYNVCISRDETREVGRARAILRKSANKARSQGKTVYQHDDYILIDGQKYYLNSVGQLEGKTTYAEVAEGK